MKKEKKNNRFYRGEKNKKLNSIFCCNFTYNIKWTVVIKIFCYAFCFSTYSKDWKYET